MDLLGISRARTLGSRQGKPHCTEVRTEGDSSCVSVVADGSAFLDSLFNAAFNNEPLHAASEHRPSQALKSPNHFASVLALLAPAIKSLLTAMYCWLLKCLASMGKKQQTGID